MIRLLLVMLLALLGCGPRHAPLSRWDWQAPGLVRHSKCMTEAQLAAWRQPKDFEYFSRWKEECQPKPVSACLQAHYSVLTGDAEILDRLGYCGEHRGVYVIGETRCYSNDTRPKFWDAKDLRCY